MFLDTRSAGAAAAPAASAAVQQSPQVCASLFPRSHVARYAVKVAVFVVVLLLASLWWLPLCSPAIVQITPHRLKRTRSHRQIPMHPVESFRWTSGRSAWSKLCRRSTRVGTKCIGWTASASGDSVGAVLSSQLFVSNRAAPTL